MYDVAIVGLGPAGRALASRCAAARMSVLAIDANPDASWRQTLCVWRDQLPPWLSPEVISLSVVGPQVRARSSHTVDLTYCLLDNTILQRELALPADSVTVVRRTVDARGLRALRDVARRVIDCRGAVPSRTGSSSTAVQSAIGLVVPAEHGAAALDGAPALLMDWTADNGQDPATPPSFLYALPLPGNKLLLEETCLAARPALPAEVLRSRLHTRLVSRGVPADAIDQPLNVEHVHIPLRPASRWLIPGIDTFGTAAGHGQPATGYSVAASLNAATSAVNALSSGRRLRPPRDHLATLLHRVGLRALIGADEDTTLELFDAFGGLSNRLQLWYLTSGTPWHQVGHAMWQMWWHMPHEKKPALVSAVARG